MIERNDARHDAHRLADRKIDGIAAHRNRCALHFGDEPGEKFELHRRDARVAHHLANRIAAVRRIDQRELIGVVAHDRRKGLHDARALERGGVAPLRKTLFGGDHRSIGVFRRTNRNAAERSSSAGIDRVGVTT